MDALKGRSYGNLPTAEICARELTKLIGVPFSRMPEHMPANRSSKGYAGHLIESVLGLPRDSRHLDLADGEVKTFKVDPSGAPKETIAVTLVGAKVDDYIGKDVPVPFAESRVGTKLANVVYVGISKPISSDPGTWSVASVAAVSNAAAPDLFQQIEDDYADICSALRKRVVAGGRISTTTGRNGLLQVRCKDSKRVRADGTRGYSPLSSAALGRQVADKNHAFYLKKPFIEALRDANGGA